MTAFNVVRFRVKAGEEARFIEYHRNAKPDFKGFLGGAIVKTGEQSFCFVAEWKNLQNIVDARPGMIAMLDGIRDALEDLGNGLGLTDPVSGSTVLKLAMPKPKKKAQKAKQPASKKKVAAKKKPAKKK